MTPLFSWLRPWGDAQRHGRLEAIYVAADAGAPMCALTEVEVVVGAGLSGDRYAAGRGHWRRTDGCELTAVSAAAIAAAERRAGVPLAAGEHRRNLVIGGIDLDALRRHTLRIGEVELAFHKLRPPCAYLDRVAMPGTAKALRRAGGIGLRVVRGGTLRVGDPVEVVIAPGDPAIA